MSNIINFETHKKQEEIDPFEHWYHEHFSKALEDQFGNQWHWGEEEMKYLLEQLMNYMYEGDEEGSCLSLVFLGLALTAFKNPVNHTLKRLFCDLDFMHSYLSGVSEDVDDNLITALEVVCEFLQDL